MAKTTTLGYIKYVNAAGKTVKTKHLYSRFSAKAYCAEHGIENFTFVPVVENAIVQSRGGYLHADFFSVLSK
jgi:hypothetical protein